MQNPRTRFQKLFCVLAASFLSVLSHAHNPNLKVDTNDTTEVISQFQMPLISQVAYIPEVSSFFIENKKKDNDDVEIRQEGVEAPIFPEPMVFDLVRPLGANKGEFEFNTLFRVPIGRRRGRVYWAPEIEYAFANGYAVELELPMINNQIEAYKVALQGTFSYNSSKTFIHGWQVISEYILEDEFLESTILYLAGYDLGQGYSVFFMAGGRNNAPMGSSENGLTPDSRWDLLLNSSFNYKVKRGTILSLESNYARQLGSGFEFRVIPQVHQRIANFLIFQGGVGYEWYLNQSFPVAASRLVFEF